MFIAATCNDVSALRPELLRKGRFDEVFFVDQPEPVEREDIFRLHVARRGRDPAGFDLAGLAGAAEGFSGAEIEAAVVGGLYRAFAAGEDLTTEGMLSEIENTVPLSRARREDLAALRSWAKERGLAA